MFISCWKYIAFEPTHCVIAMNVRNKARMKSVASIYVHRATKTKISTSFVWSLQLLQHPHPATDDDATCLSSLSSTDYRKYTHSLEICQNLSKLHKSTHDRWKTDSPKLALCLVRLCTYKFNCRSIKCLYLLIIKLSVRDNFLFVTAHGSHRFVTCNFNDAWTKKTYCSIRTWELKTTRDHMMPPPPHVCNM